MSADVSHSQVRSANSFLIAKDGCIDNGFMGCLQMMVNTSIVAKILDVTRLACGIGYVTAENNIFRYKL